MCCVHRIPNKGHLLGFAEVADWQVFQHFEQVRETVENW
jgi:hypothetical protein